MGVSSGSRWPTGHAGWFFSELAEFEALATRFLADGLRRGDRIMFVSEARIPRRWPGDLIDQGVLVLGSVGDVYAPLRDGDVAAQRSLFAKAVADARRDGFKGIRVAADNTRMAAERIDAWLDWESVAGDLMKSDPVDGLCCFDRSVLALDALRRLTLVHPKVVDD